MKFRFLMVMIAVLVFASFADAGCGGSARGFFGRFRGKARPQQAAVVQVAQPQTVSRPMPKPVPAPVAAPVVLPVAPPAFAPVLKRVFSCEGGVCKQK